MKHTAFFVALGLGLAGCVTADARPSADGYAQLGQPARSGPFTVTPLRVIEDSRCPRSVTCVWAGQVRIEARIAGPGFSQTSELTLGKPVGVGRSGSLGLTQVLPDRATPAALPVRRYRFAFTFYPGG